MKRYLDEVRALERDLTDSVSNGATRCFEYCQRRVERLQMAIDSDLFSEFDEARVARLREIAAGVRVKHGLLIKELDDLHRAADQCDEMLTVYETAQELDDEDGQTEAAEKLIELVARIRQIHERSTIVCRRIKEQQDEQLTIFERMRMMTLEEAAGQLGVPLAEPAMNHGVGNGSGLQAPQSS